MRRLAVRRLRLLFLYLLLALPLVIYGARASLSSNANSPLDWVTASYPARADYDEFCESFGPGDTVILSWEGCTLDEPRLDRLAYVLRESKSFRDTRGDWLFDSVVSGREVVEQLTSGPAPIDRDVAAHRLQGSLVGRDGRTTCLVIAFTPDGLRYRGRLVNLIQSAVDEVCGVPPDEQRLAGPVIDGLSVDVASKAALDRLALPSALVVLVSACWCLRSIRAGVFVFGLALFAQGSTLALVFYCGDTMSALLIVLPPLIQVLAVAGGIHLANYYFDAVPTHGATASASVALERGWLPCVLSAGTTAVGMASLMVSELSPIRAFGAYSAAGVLMTSGLLLAVLPALFAQWPPSSRRAESPDSVRRARRMRRTWSKLTLFLSRRHPVAVAGILLLLVGAGCGVRHLTTSVRIETLFGRGSRIVDDYRWLEAHVGPLVPMEVVVAFDSDCPLSSEQRMSLLWRLDQAVRELPAVGGTLSPIDFLPSLPDRASLPPEAYSAAVRQTLEASRPTFRDVGRLFVNAQGEQWRLSVFVSALDKMDYGDFLTQLSERTDPLLLDVKSAKLAGVSANYTGIMALVHQIQRQLMQDLFRSFVAAFALIALVMTVAQAGIAAGLVTMIPNVFPTVVMLGLLGWSGVPLDIGTVMTVSVALGIAVDDTLHYVTFYRRALERGRSRRAAVNWAYRHCGTAMMQTSVICGLGLAVFAASDFVPTQRFAMMMVALMGLALLGDLVLLPALLIGPAGKLFATDEVAGAPSTGDLRSTRAARLGEKASSPEQAARPVHKSPASSQPGA